MGQLGLQRLQDGLARLQRRSSGQDRGENRCKDHGVHVEQRRRRQPSSGMSVRTRVRGPSAQEPPPPEAAPIPSPRSRPLAQLSVSPLGRRLPGDGLQGAAPAQTRALRPGSAREADGRGDGRRTVPTAQG